MNMEDKNVKIDLSIIVPCYNEDMVLEESVAEIKRVMDCARCSWELIFVDDGSTDATRGMIKELCALNPEMSFIFHERNMGRGQAVKTGIMACRGEAAGFLDIDLSTPAVFIPRFWMYIKDGADVVTALRVYKILEMKKLWFNVLKLILHTGYRILLKILFNLPLRDTETGFKFFNRQKALPLLEKVKSKHWFWDTEVMARAYLEGYKILEVPSLFLRKHEHGSRVRVVRDVIYYLRKLAWFRNELKKIKRKPAAA